MTDETHKNLRNGLFASTSAFEQADARTYPARLVIPHSSAHTVLSHSEQMAKIVALIESALFLDIEDAELTSLLDEVLEIARDHA